jgi:hypothetical protein
MTFTKSAVVCYRKRYPTLSQKRERVGHPNLRSCTGSYSFSSH